MKKYEEMSREELWEVLCKAHEIVTEYAYKPRTFYRELVKKNLAILDEVKPIWREKFSESRV